MSTSTAAAESTPRQEAASGDWLKPYLKWAVIPSWILSALIHTSLIFVWISLSQSEGCRADVGVGDGEGFREVGLVERDAPGKAGEGNTSAEPGAPGSPSASAASDPDAVGVEQLVAESLAVPPGLSAASSTSTLPILGAGPPELSTGNAGTLLQPSGSGLSSVGEGSIPGTGASGGGTSLFGVNDAGQRFVYVLDNSGSMNSFHALQSAKNELIRSVEALDEAQQFLVIFYNVELTILAPRSAPQRMFQGTDAHRLDLGQQIAAIEGNGGTDHVLALREALKYHADVVFFLTDAGRPGLTTAEIEDITERNGGASRIHCIEFGESPEFARDDPSNSLRRLADMNHGRYTYKDVRSFLP